MGKNPCDIVGEKFIVSTVTILRLVFLKNLTPPINKYDYVQQSISAQSAEGLPMSSYFARDYTTFDQPP